MTTRPPLQAQRGQALTEFLLVALALVPLFLLLPVVAKLQDMAHSTLMAARYAAFRATQRHPGAGGFQPEAELADEVRQRFFAGTGQPIRTPTAASGDDEVPPHAFWRQPDGRPLIARFADVQLGFGAAAGARHADGLAAASDGAPFALHSRLQNTAHGIYTAQLSVRVADLPAGVRAYEPFDRLGLAMSRRTSLAFDGWSGRDPASVQGRLNDTLIFPGRALRSASALIRPVVAVVELPGPIPAPRLGRLDFWQDVVPPDRLHRP
jgi:hypothetical protein